MPTLCGTEVLRISIVSSYLKPYLYRCSLNRMFRLRARVNMEALCLEVSCSNTVVSCDR